MYEATIRKDGKTERIRLYVDNGPDAVNECKLYQQIGYEILDLEWTGGCV